MGVYVYRNDRVEGPFDELVLQQALMNGTMNSSELCCREGGEDWTSASTFFARTPNSSMGSAKPSVPLVLSVRRSTLLPLQNFWSRLSKGQVVALTTVAIVIGLPVGLVILANLVGEPGSIPVQPPVHQSAETIDEQIARVEDRQNELKIQFVSMMAQAEQAKQNGQTLTPEGAGLMAQILLRMTQENEDLKRRKENLIEQKSKGSPSR